MRQDSMTGAENETFAAVLKRYRVASGLTHEQLAERAGLSVRGISDLERGARVRPRAYTVHQLANALGLSSDDRTIFEAAARNEVNGRAGNDLSPMDAVFGPLPEGELVAREEEEAHLRAALAAAEGGAGTVVLLGGEQGIGKTRLLTEVAAHAGGTGYVVVGARCMEAQRHIALAPFVAALGGLAASPPAGVRTEVQRGWKRVARLAERPSSNGGGERESSAVEQGELIRAVTDLLLLVARTSPVVMLLDDLQWADHWSLLLLVQLARSIRSAPILLLGAFHDVRLAEENPALAQTIGTLGRERLVDRLTVRRLSLEETTRMVGNLMGEGAVSEEFAHFVYRRTKGIPRLIEQLVRSLGGRLELQGEIGAGAMGRVFRAYDRERKEEVAAKLVLSRSEIDLDALLRFQQEGAVLARLEHPHIVDIYDTFAEEHASCIIMELLQGQSLGGLLQEGPLPPSRAKALAVQVAEALAYAHSQQIVHRDIKPDNVMVLEGDGVKVTDFGIARILQPDTSLGTIATTGMRMGTPLYMAPEQIGGKKVDGRTDIYALGAMLYHMVTGRPPFEGDDALAVAVKHLQEEPAPPSRLDPAIPADWDSLILKAMAKDPKERYRSAGEMGSAIAALSERAAPGATPRRRRWIAGAVGVVGLAAVAAGGLWAHAAHDGGKPGPAASIDTFLTGHHFSGYALFERHNRVLLSKGYGMADRKSGRLITINTRMPVPGSNRFMAAVAILRLQDQHRLSVHDRVCRYVAPCPRAWRSITIHQLLLGTSGLGDFDRSLLTGGVPEAIARCRDLPVQAAGTISMESNCDGLLLFTIVARVSGKPWAAAMQELVFRPAHMTESGQMTNAVRSRLGVTSYSADFAIEYDNYDNYYMAYSSVRDLERLDRALLAGRILSRRALKALFTPYLGGSQVLARYGASSPPLFGCYSCYLRRETSRTVTVAESPGKEEGFLVDNALSPEDGTIAIMVRNDESGADPRNVFSSFASHLLWGKETEGSPRTVALAQHVATYMTKHRFSGYV